MDSAFPDYWHRFSHESWWRKPGMFIKFFSFEFLPRFYLFIYQIIYPTLLGEDQSPTPCADALQAVLFRKQGVLILCLLPRSLWSYSRWIVPIIALKITLIKSYIHNRIRRRTKTRRALDLGYTVQAHNGGGWERLNFELSDYLGCFQNWIIPEAFPFVTFYFHVLYTLLRTQSVRHQSLLDSSPRCITDVHCAYG